jgi:hypothetical protein
MKSGFVSVESGVSGGTSGGGGGLSFSEPPALSSFSGEADDWKSILSTVVRRILNINALNIVDTTEVVTILLGSALKN